MCALDFHLFADLEYAVTQNILAASCGSPWVTRDNGTPAELSLAIRRTWKAHPLPA